MDLVHIEYPSVVLWLCLVVLRLQWVEWWQRLVELRWSFPYHHLRLHPEVYEVFSLVIFNILQSLSL
jgi:hypothetical protein